LKVNEWASVSRALMFAGRTFDAKSLIDMDLKKPEPRDFIEARRDK